jgi:hypothetical protein
MGVRVRQRSDRPSWWLFINHQGKQKKKHFPDKETTLRVARKVRERLALGGFSDAEEPPPEDRAIMPPVEVHLRTIHRCVYFLQATNGGPIKIGFSRDLLRRIHELNSASPIPLRVVGVIAGGDQETEAELHAWFAGARLHGEWFRPIEALVQHITDITSPTMEGAQPNGR